MSAKKQSRSQKRSKTSEQMYIRKGLLGIAIFSALLMAHSPTALADVVAEAPTKVEATEQGSFAFKVTVTNKCPPDDGPITFSKAQFIDVNSGAVSVAVTGAPARDTKIPCNQSFVLEVTGILIDPKIAGSITILILAGPGIATTGTGVTPFKPPPPPKKKKDIGSLGSNTLAGAGGGALINLATGVGELTLGVGALVSGGLGALGGFLGTGLWLLIDPPQGITPVIQSKWVIGLIVIALFVLAAIARRFRKRPLLSSFFASMAIGGAIGVVAGLINLDGHLMPMVSLVTGVLIGIIDVIIFGNAGPSVTPNL